MPKGFSIKDELLRLIYNELQSLEHSRKTPFIENHAQKLGVSKATLYRRLERFGETKQRVQRQTKYTPELVEKAWEIQATFLSTQLKGSSYRLATRDIIDMVESEGLIKTGEWSVSGLNNAFKKLGFRDVQARIRIEAEHYAQQYQMDFSRSKHFQVIGKTPDGEDYILKVSSKALFYKDVDVRMRTWVTMAIDEYSRLRVARYAPATAESPLLGINFLDHLFTRPEDGNFMRHKPEIIKGDQGAFLKSEEVKNALDSVGIKREMAPPGNKESNGKIERAWQALWQRFERPLATRITREHGADATMFLSELNELLDAHLIAIQSEFHPFHHNQVKLHMAQMSAQNVRPEIIDGSLLESAFKTWERTVGIDCGISLFGVRFQTPAHCAGKKITVYRTLHEEYFASIVGEEERVFAIEPYQTGTLGEFSQSRPKAIATRVNDRVKEEMKVKRMTHKAERIRPSAPTIDVESIPIEKPQQTLVLIKAKLRFRDQLAKYALKHNLFNNPSEEIAQAVRAASEKGLLFNEMTIQMVDDLAERVIQTVLRKAS